MKLTITDPGSLLPVILDKEITPEQVEQVQALIERGPLATLPLRTLQVLLGALNALEDPFSDENDTRRQIEIEIAIRQVDGD